MTALSLSDLQAFSSDADLNDSLINSSNPLGYGSNRGSPLLRKHIAESLYTPITKWGPQNYASSTKSEASEGKDLGNVLNHATPDTNKVTTLDPLTADDILVNSGTSGANNLVLDYLVGPGDHVIVQYPTYGALYEVPRRAGAEVSLWQSKERNQWVPDVAELEGLVKNNTKMLIMK